MEEKLNLPLNKPISLGSGDKAVTVTTLALREPVAGELEISARADTNIGALITLLGLASGNDRAVIEQLSRGDLQAAAAAIRADAGTDVLRVDCEPYPPAPGRYECLAVTADVPATERTPAGANGLAYRVLISGDRYAYCRLAPRAAKVQREPVALSPLCGGS